MYTRNNRTLLEAAARTREATFYIRMNAGLFDFSWNGPNKVWVFPDGSTSTADRPTKTLASAGIVELRVSNPVDWLGHFILKANSTGANWVGEFSDLPPIDYQLHLDGCTGATGSVTDLPPVTQLLSLRDCVITGNVSDLPEVTNTLDIARCSNITGVIADLPQVNYWLMLTDSGVTGDIADLPVVSLIAFMTRCAVTGSIAADNTTPSIEIKNTNISQAELDQSLINIDTAGVSNGTFRATGTHVPTAASLDARNSLIAKGWTLELDT